MATFYENLGAVIRRDAEIHFNFREWVGENITRSWWQALLLLFLSYVAIRLVISELGNHPFSTIIIVVAWVASLAATALSNITRNHSPTTTWLSKNLYSSIPNALITVILILLILAGIYGFYGWAVARASFTTDPVAAAETLAQYDPPGANWGAVIDNFRNLMVFRFPREEGWRLWLLLLWNVILIVPSAYVFSREVFRGSRLRRILTMLWFITPFIAYALLRGFGESGPLRELNPDIVWGGLLLTVIIAVFAIIASFPLGVILALGRRSQIRGIPSRLIWAVAIIATAICLFVVSLPMVQTAERPLDYLLALWPLLILLFAYLFIRYFQGNVVAMFSTIYIEVIRGVPLITILFMSIIIFPIFLPPGVQILGTWRVLVAAALFSAAYLAENVRGGLQSIPKGQYEAADAVGLNTYKKYRLIILPQALRAVIPAIVGQFIGLFKDTTLVAIVGLIELLGVANLISAQPDWLGVRREPYVFIAAIYFIGSFAMASYSRRLERRLGVGER